MAQELESHPGRGIYVQSCSSCHGIDLQGGNAQSLADAVWQYGSGMARFPIILNMAYSIWDARL